MVSVVAGKHFLWFPSLFVNGFRRGRERFLMVSGCYRIAAVSPMETLITKTPGRFHDELRIYTHIYIYDTYVYIYIYIYIFIGRERERERKRQSAV